MPKRSKPLMTVKDFGGLIDEVKDGTQRAIRRNSVERVLNWFEELRPMMSKESVSATANYLQNEKWVKHAATPGAHEHYKRAKGNAKRGKSILYFPDLIIVLASFVGNKTVNNLVDEYSEHWGFQFSKTEPSYPSGLDPIAEMRLFEGRSKRYGSVLASPPDHVPGTINSGRKRESDPLHELNPLSGITLPAPQKRKPVIGPATKSLLESQSSSVASSKSTTETSQDSNYPSSLGVPKLSRFTDDNKTFTSHEQSQHGMFEYSNGDVYTPHKPQFPSAPHGSDLVTFSYNPFYTSAKSLGFQAKPSDLQSNISDLRVQPSNPESRPLDRDPKTSNPQSKFSDLRVKPSDLVKLSDPESKPPNRGSKAFDPQPKSSDLRVKPHGNQSTVLDDESDFALTAEAAWAEERNAPIDKAKAAEAKAESEKAKGVVSYLHGCGRKSLSRDVDMTAKSTTTSSIPPQHELGSSQLQASKGVKDTNISSGPVTSQSSNNNQTRAYGYKHAQNSSILTNPQVVNKEMTTASSAQYHKDPFKRNGHQTASDIILTEFCEGLGDKTQLPEQRLSALPERAQQKLRYAPRRLDNEDKERHETETTYYRELTKIRTNRINQLETEVESLKKENVILRETQQRRTTTQEAETQTESTSSDSFPTRQLIDVVNETMTRGMAKVTEDIKTAVMDLLDEATP